MPMLSGRPNPPTCAAPASATGGFETTAVTYTPIPMKPTTPMLNNPVYPQWRFNASASIPNTPI